jgi:LDH2 family malate/lactate/ureidoglycolate dehydrogenase
MSLIVKRKELKEFVKELLIKLQIPQEDAEIVSEVLVDTDMRGIKTHGIYRLPVYIRRIENKVVNNRPNIRIDRDSGSLFVIDGDYGLGQVVAYKSLNVLMERARGFGIAAAFIRKSSHFGAAGFYARRGATMGFITIVSSNASGTMYPYGGNRRVIGNNPWSIGIPNERPLVLDIANSVVAKGKIRVAADKGEEIPENWALDKEGNPTRDPKRALEGSLQWMGGHKGYGISVIVEILSSLISGSSFLDEVSDVTQVEKRQDLGHFMVAIDVSKLIPLSEFKERVKDYVKRIKERGSLNREVMVPGEPEERFYEKALREGIDLSAYPEVTLEELRKIGKKYGVEPPF